MPKRTFFSRLMGSDVVEENAGEMEIANVSFETNNMNSNPYQPTENPLFMNESLTEEYTSESAEWTPDYEGQLMVDVFQTKDDVIIQSIVAGVGSEDIDITIANDKVTIEGERRRKVDVPLEDYFYQECYWGPFSRSIVLPVDVDADNAEAKMNQGILTIVLPKAEKAKVRKVQVKRVGE